MTTPIRPSEATLVEVRQALQRIELFRRQLSIEATSQPGSADDLTKGYTAGSLLTDTVKKVVWRSIVDKEGAAEWVRLISVIHTDGGVAATPKGFILASNASGDYIPLGVGADGKVLTADSSQTVGMQWHAGPTQITLIAGAVAAGSVGTIYGSHIKVEVS